MQSLFETLKEKCLKIFVVYAAVLLCFVAIGCASGVKRVEYPESTSAQVKHNEIMTTFHEKQQSQVDVLATREFREGEKYLDRATNNLDRGDDNATVLNNLGMAEAYLNLAQEKADKVRSRVDVALSARQQALNAGAKDVSGPALASLDNEFGMLTQEVSEGGVLNNESMVSLQKRYLNLQSVVIQKDKLSQAYQLRDQAREAGAIRYAPKTFKEARMRILSAENVIAADRTNEQKITSEMTAAVAAAQKALDVTLLAKDVKGIGTNREETALKMWEKDAQLKTADADIQNIRSQNQMLQDQTSNLNSRVNRLSATTRRLQSEADWNDYIKSAQAEFSPDEAEVLRQGDQLIVRLKSMKFPTNHAELPASALDTLNKVSDVAAGMVAKELIIEGHTDSVGSAAQNKELSLKRAEAVKQYLADASSIDPEIVETRGMGFDRPITSNKTAEGRATNRRVDVIIVP